MNNGDVDGARATSDGVGKVIITGGYRNGLLSKVTYFDLENGFRVIDDFKLDEQISEHVALPLL